jgi:hypothetical protein
VLAVTSKTRSQLLSDVPTTAEAGYADIEGDGWVGALVPAGTPKEIITLLHDEIVGIIAMPDVKERLPTLGFDPVASTPDEFSQQIKNEIPCGATLPDEPRSSRSNVWGEIVREFVGTLFTHVVAPTRPSLIA